MIPIFKDPPLGTKNPSPAERLPVTYNGYTINSPAGTAEDSIELVETAVTPIVDQVIENKQQRDGMEVYQAYKSGLMIRLRGWIKKPTLNALMDEASLMSEKFDAALISRRTQSSTIGFQPLAFSVPTNDTVNYPGGLVPSFYSARTVEPITFGRTKYDGYAMPFRIEMIARDPSRFFSTRQDILISGSNPGGGTANNLLGTYPSWPTLTFIMVGAGHWYFAVYNQQAFGGQKVLALNLSTLINGDQVRVDFEQRRIYKNNVLAMQLYDSGEYWQIEPRVSANIVTQGDQNVANRFLTWYRAFPT